MKAVKPIEFTRLALADQEYLVALDGDYKGRAFWRVYEVVRRDPVAPPKGKEGNLRLVGYTTASRDARPTPRYFRRFAFYTEIGDNGLALVPPEGMAPAKIVGLFGGPANERVLLLAGSSDPDPLLLWRYWRAGITS